MAYSFPWQADSGSYTPADIERRRKLADRLQGNMVKDAGPLGAIQNALAGSLGGYEERQAQMGEDAGRAGADEIFSALSDASSQGDMIKALSNPFASEGQRAVAKALFSAQLDNNDPDTLLDRRYKEAQISKLLGDGAGGDENFFGNPLFTQDAEGNIIVNQMGNKGTLHPLQMPEGQTLAPPTKTVNTETEQIVMDNFGNIISRIPIQNREAASETAIGKGLGENAVAGITNLPNAVATAEQTMQQIDQVINDPHLGEAVGIGGLLPPIPGTAQAGTVTRIEQLQGRAFLQAFESLKGAGQITEIEGQKATEAIARLNRSQNREDFVTALNDLKGIIQSGMDRAKMKAGQEVAPVAPIETAPMEGFDPIEGFDPNDVGIKLVSP